MAPSGEGNEGFVLLEDDRQGTVVGEGRSDGERSGETGMVIGGDLLGSTTTAKFQIGLGVGWDSLLLGSIFRMPILSTYPVGA